ncbi:MAG: class I SAM-dependent methyltransferase [Alphaproteobacteria bacterium]
MTCALCKSADREVIQTQSLALINRALPCDVTFAVCNACGHLQQWPPVAPDVMAHHYQSVATYELFGAPQELRAAPPARHAKRFLSLVADIGLAPGKAYEIGCASGEMLNQFRRIGWDVAGCDLSPSAIDQAKAIFGIDADLGGEEVTLPGRKGLDLVMACHVLEHLYDPPAALARIHEALAPGGHFVFEVPCAIAPDALPPGWFTFEHLHYYQPAILERLLKDSGFAVVEMRIAMTCEHYPVVAIAARKAAGTAALSPFQPSEGARMAHRYAARDDALWAATASRVERYREPVFLYGAGIHTAQLLDRTAIAPHVIAIADRDSKKWGQTQAGKPVISPAQLLAHPLQAPVIISSYVSERPIVKALREGGLAAARIVPLYSDSPVC